MNNNRGITNNAEPYIMGWCICAHTHKHILGELCIVQGKSCYVLVIVNESFVLCSRRVWLGETEHQSFQVEFNYMV